MKNKLITYKKICNDLLKQIDLCNLYKKEIQDTLTELNSQYKSNIIDKETYDYNINKYLEGKSSQDWYSMYDSHINGCINNINQYNEKINEIAKKNTEKKNLNAKLFLFLGLLSLIISAIFLVQPNITGLIAYSDKPLIKFEDGYSKEGYQWLEIKGSKVYERCLKVNSDVDFNRVTMLGKVMRAGDTRDLTFELYKNNEINDEPSQLISSCKVNKYYETLKSCTINDLKESKGKYWICALSPGGDPSATYYTIAYQNGDLRKTALWTGTNWQKLEGSSYTIKAQFIQNE